MKFLLFLNITFFVLFIRGNAQPWFESQKINVEDPHSNNHFGENIAIFGDWAIIGVPNEDIILDGVKQYNVGAAYILKHDPVSKWKIAQKIIASDPDSNDQFGCSVDISPDYIVVGAQQEEKDSKGENALFTAGAVYIFKRNHDGIWVQLQKLVPLDRKHEDNFGCSVSISGSTLVVGSKNARRNIDGFEVMLGAAYVFEKENNENWLEVAKLFDSTNYEKDGFARSVGVSENYAIIGALSHALDQHNDHFIKMAGAAYIFERINGEWINKQKLVASDRSISALFGSSVSISKNQVIVGAIIDQLDSEGLNPLEYAGSAYLYMRNENGYWDQKQKIVASDRSSGDQFGSSVSIDKNHFVIGASDKEVEDSIKSAGVAYIYTKNSEDIWYQDAKLIASDKAPNDWFGCSVAIRDSTIMVGAKNSNEIFNGITEIPNIGSVYVFEWNDVLGFGNVNSEVIVNGYPNPTTGDYTILFGNEYQYVNLIINNVHGQIIYKNNYIKPKKINLTLNEPSGLYFIKITGSNDEYTILKVIKN